jgi:hypothetical protein
MTETFSECGNHPSNGQPHNGHSHHCAHVVVRPHDPAATLPGRRVEVLGQLVGRAGSIADLGHLCRQAGLPDLDLTLPSSIEWIGGDAHTWPARTDSGAEK